MACLDASGADVAQRRPPWSPPLAGGLYLSPRARPFGHPFLPRDLHVATTRSPASVGDAKPPLPCALNLCADCRVGASCETDADCGFDLIICNDGVCGL